MPTLRTVLRFGLVACLAFVIGSSSVAVAVDDHGGLGGVWSALFADRPAYLESGEVTPGPVHLRADPSRPLTCATAGHTAKSAQPAVPPDWVAFKADGAV